MEIIASGKRLNRQLARLLASYSEIVFAVAWASANTSTFEALVANSSKIKQAVIGTHFYQTDPEVLEAFVGSKNVRFVTQPNGVFHPKVYLFRNKSSWEALIGSANLTRGALTANSEVVILVTDSDGGADVIDRDIAVAINAYWKDAKVLTAEDVGRYRELWRSKQSDRRSLSGSYSKAKHNHPPMESRVSSMSWSQYVKEVRDGNKSADIENLEARIGFLSSMHMAFLSHENFASMDQGLRQAIAGLPNEYDERSPAFGSMKGAGRFWNAVNSNDLHLSRALDKIPLVGPVSKTQFDEYVAELIGAFPSGRHGVATASRLLAMKRPDYFVCLSKRNRKALCKDFAIPASGIDYQRYWEEVVSPVLDAPWWREIRPKDESDGAIWDGRVAMLDSIFYRP